MTLVEAGLKPYSSISFQECAVPLAGGMKDDDDYQRVDGQKDAKVADALNTSQS